MGNTCRARTMSVDPDSAWKQQNKEMETNPMYKIINYKNGGTGILVDAFNEGGVEEVERVARREVEPYLYNRGKGAVITKLEYVKWLHCSSSKINALAQDPAVDGYVEVQTKSDQALLNIYEEDYFCKFHEHEACWDLNKRGGVGETPFHLAHLCESAVVNEVIKILIRMYPKLTLDVYEGIEYFGESALHIAVVVGDFDKVKNLVENGANINQRATGRFFLPEDQKKTPSKESNYTGYAYFGEYPLAFAACFHYQDIYDYLMEQGADPNMQDSFGNTVLHMVIIADQPAMFRYAVRHHIKSANTEIRNKNGLTPLTLASKLGRHNIFKEMLELESVELWRYNNILCSAYPLTSLDSISPTGETNWNSALMIIVNGETDEHLDMLHGGVIHQLLEEKWKTYARGRFILRLVIAFIHLALISVAIYMRPDGDQLLGYRGHEDIIRYIAEVLVLLGCLSSIMVDGIAIGSQGVWAFIGNCMHAPAQTVNMLSSFLILLCVPFRLLYLSTVEDVLLIIAIPGSWFFLLFFARGFKLTGPFVTMIYKMIKGDLFRFALIYLIFLIGFTQAFYFLFRHVETDNTDVLKFSTFPDTVINLFQMTLGEFKYEVFDFARYPPLTKMVFALFMILVPILLLNMLIAMMGNTYTQVISKSEMEWRKQWAKIVVVLERGFSKKQLLKFQQDYAVKIKNNKNKKDAQAIVVIKDTSKSKAKQRKDAMGNWKRVGKEVVTQLKEAKRRGESVKLHQRSPRPDTDSVGETPAGGLDVFGQIFHTVDQLAWERDIDLTKGQTFISDPEVIEKVSPRGEDGSPVHKVSNIPNGRPKQVERILPSGPLMGSPKSKKPIMYSNRVFPLQDSLPEEGCDLSELANERKDKSETHRSPTKSLFSVTFDTDKVDGAVGFDTVSQDEQGRETPSTPSKRKKDKKKRKKSPKKSTSTPSQSSLTSLLRDTPDLDTPDIPNVPSKDKETDV